MIQFDDSSSKSIQQKPIVHKSTHVEKPIKEVTSEEEEEQKREGNEQAELLQPGKNDYIIYEDPLVINKQKLKKKKLRMEDDTISTNSSNTDTDTDTTTDTVTTTDTDEPDISSDEITKPIKKKKMTKAKQVDGKKKKKKIKTKRLQSNAAAAKQKKGTKKQVKKATAIVQKTKKIFERALKDLKKLK